MISRWHPRIRNDDGIAAQFSAILFQKGPQAAASNFFFALNYKDQVTGQIRPGFQIRLNCLYVSQMLPFVVRCAAGKKGSPDHPGLKWRRLPKFKRLRWLHVIMTIDQKTRPAAAIRGSSRGFCDYDRIAFGRAKPSVQA